MRRGWRAAADHDDHRGGREDSEFSQTLPRQFRTRTPSATSASRPPRPGPSQSEHNKPKGNYGWREAKMGTSIQKSNSLTNIGTCSQYLTENRPIEAQEALVMDKSLPRKRESSLNRRHHAGIRRSTSLRSLLANTGEYLLHCNPPLTLDAFQISLQQPQISTPGLSEWLPPWCHTWTRTRGTA